MRSLEELYEEFNATGEDNFAIWLSSQPEGMPLERKIISSIDKNKVNPDLVEIPEEKTMPSNSEMAKDLAVSLKAIAKSGIKMCSKKIYNERYSICTNCEELNDVGRCFKCGCFMKLKVRFDSVKCPIGKW